MTKCSFCEIADGKLSCYQLFEDDLVGAKKISVLKYFEITLYGYI